MKLFLLNISFIEILSLLGLQSDKVFSCLDNLWVSNEKESKLEAFWLWKMIKSIKLVIFGQIGYHFLVSKVQVEQEQIHYSAFCNDLYLNVFEWVKH
jgi:hypothetical protein